MRVYHHVFPQPGCDTAALSSEPQREKADQILRDWREDGPPEQGCCCNHSLLTAEEVKQLRAAGFSVEEDASNDG